jgi:DtxR family Mn-dependent transcriptional regulator
LKGKLSEPMEDYIITIYRLEEVFGVAKTSVIARELGVKPATVTKIVSWLVKEGIATTEKYKGTRLTAKGRSIAEKIVKKHRILEAFLHQLGFDPYKSHLLAHRLEHIPDEVVYAIYDYIGRPKMCPHGNPIADIDVPSEPRLCDLKVGTRARIVRILGELKSVMSMLNDVGCWRGDEVRIVDKWKQGARLLCGEKEITINLDVCRSLVVEVLGSNDDTRTGTPRDEGKGSGR